jgi:hypothetical protein
MLTWILAQTAPVSPSPLLLKDWVVPLVGPAVSLFVALLFFWLAPRRQRKRELAIDLWKIYNSDEMQTARREAWQFLHGETDANKVKERVAQFWEWALVLGSRPQLVADAPNFQQVQKVFDFFATCNQCLEMGEVDEDLLKASLGYYFSRWSEDTVEALVRENPPDKPLTAVTRRPAWLDGMPKFRSIMGMPPPCKITQAS